MTVAITSVAKPKDVADELGGKDALENLTSESLTVNAVLSAALSDVLDSLRNRTPSIAENHISTPSELTRVVVLRSCARLYLAAITTGEDVNAVKHKIYQRDYESALASLRPTVSAGLSASGFSIPMHRR
jgi:hypothetical protein